MSEGKRFTRHRIQDHRHEKRPPSLFEVALFDTEDADEGGFVAEVVRLRTSRDQCPKPYDFGYSLVFLRGVRVFRVQIAQLLNSRFGLVWRRSFNRRGFQRRSHRRRHLIAMPV